MRLIVFVLLGAVSSVTAQYAKLVNPFIGTGGHGHTFPGATLPFGGCQVSPDTRVDGSWDGCSGYHYSDSLIYGFSHTHLSGTGVSDWGDILLMPVKNNVSLKNYAYAQHFMHRRESAHAGYYAVSLIESGIQVELTATLHGAIHRYKSETNQPNKIVLDLAHRDEVTESYVEKIDDYTLRGYRFSKAWAQNQKVFFEIQFDDPIDHIIYEDSNDSNAKAQHLLITLKKKEHQDNNFTGTCDVRVAISGVDMDGAHRNLQSELAGKSFETLKAEAEKSWDKELSKINVEIENTTQKQIFYSALYHCMIHPSLYSDVDGRYRGRDDQIHSTSGKFDYYTVFSLWDTYRALHPLLTLIDKKRTNDFIQTFLCQYQQGGRLPIWELSSNETNCMIGYHVVSVIWDAYSKGIRDYDTSIALEAMIRIADEDWGGKKKYAMQGYLSIEDESESVSKTLEYSYDDWCISQFAKAMRKDSIAKVFETRSLNARNLYNWKSGFYEPRSNGGFVPSYKASEVNNYFTEGNGWQYMRGNHLTDVLYSDSNIVVMPVDSLFLTHQKLSGREQSDVTGLIGQYAHGNEPSHHLAYLIDNDSLREKMINHIYYQFYKNEPDGLIGNEDCGQMSAWYIWTSLGMYPVIPGSLKYNTCQPKVSQAVIQDGSDHPITTSTIRQSTNRSNIKSPIDHHTLTKNILLNPKRNRYSAGIKILNKEAELWQMPCLPPSIQIPSMVFRDSMLITISTCSGGRAEYRLDDKAYTKYDRSFYVYQSGHINSRNGCNYTPIYNKSDIKNHQTMTSSSTMAEYYRRSNNYAVQLYFEYNPQYTAGGADGLVDGLYGDIDWRKGRWMGVQGDDLELVIDLKDTIHISEVIPHFLEDQRSWIFFPRCIEISASKDGITYTDPVKTNINHTENETENSLRSIPNSLKVKNVRYIKIKAKQYGKLPEWHPGRGGESFIFIDEIEILTQK